MPNLASTHIRITSTGCETLATTSKRLVFFNLAATHSGYFTRRQFLSFTHQTKGCLVHRFTTKLLTQHHALATQYGHKTYVFKLTSRKLYDLIGKQDLRDHRSHTADFIRKRLLVLDFVLSHPDLQYVESEEEKLKFFPRTTGPASQLSPGRTDIAKGLDPTLKRYFKDRFPFFVSARNGSTPGSAPPTFVYCDPAHQGISWFAGYLDRHQALLRRLPAFEPIYAMRKRVIGSLETYRTKTAAEKQPGFFV